MFKGQWKPIRFSFFFVGMTFGTLMTVRSNRLWEQRNQDWVSLIFSRPKQLKPIDWLPEPLSNIYEIISHQWKSSSEAQKLAISLISTNALVFFSWQIPLFSRFMHRHFAHDPLSGKGYTLLTSTFSHQGVMHFGFNMYALHGFLPHLEIRSGMSWEQTLAFYLSAGVLASLGSHLLSLALWKRGLRTIAPSLGASGGIWAVLVGTAMVDPYANAGIIFIPGVSFTLSELVPALVALDFLGVVRRWQTFDHIAHLSGAFVGYWYLQFGPDWWSKIQLQWYKARLEASRK